MSVVSIPAQLDPFSLSGAGSSVGDVVLNLKSFQDILGNNLTMADFGSTGYGTLEPGNRTQEEQISFSGITQNADGTAQLTGVKHVLFITPFTESSGMTIIHPGSVTFVISNTSGFYNSIYTYINTAVASGGVPATSTVQGITKLSIDPASIGTPIAVGDNDSRVPVAADTRYLYSIVNTAIPYATASGTPTAYSVSLASSISSLASGTFLNFQVPTSNATGVTLNINSLGAKPIKKNYSASLASGDLQSGQTASVLYDGVNFELQSPTPVPIAYANGSSAQTLSSTTTLQIAHGLGVIPSKVRLSSTSNFGAATLLSISQGTFDSSGQNCVYGYSQTTTGWLSGTSANAIYFISGINVLSGIVTVDATNINITWSKSNSPTGTGFILWEANS